MKHSRYFLGRHTLESMLKALRDSPKRPAFPKHRRYISTTIRLATRTVLMVGAVLVGRCSEPAIRGLNAYTYSPAFASSRITQPTVLMNPVAGTTLSVVELASQGTWLSGTLSKDNDDIAAPVAEIPFNSAYNDPRGFVRLERAIALEDGSTAVGLWTHPRWENNGTIKGLLPWVRIGRDAVFKTDIGFRAGATQTDGVTFTLWEHHTVNAQDVRSRIMLFSKKYTGKLEPIAINLSPLAGQRVQLEFRVDADNSATQDWAVWVNPLITMSR